MMNDKKDHKNAFLANLPDQPGVYQFLGEKKNVLYVGKANNLKKRVHHYFIGDRHSTKTNLMMKQVKDIEITVTENEQEALLLESNLIKQYRPRYNVLLRDDKSYALIAISQQHDFASLYQYRGRRQKHVLYFGPYPSGAIVRETIAWLQKLFYLRTCSDHFFAHRIRPCLLYQLKRCTAPCVGLIDKHTYKENVEQAILFLQGKSNELLSQLRHRMNHAAQHFEYELAAKYRDQMTRLASLHANQSVDQGKGEVDILGISEKAGLACIQRVVVRAGKVVDSRSYFLNVPLNATDQTDIMSAFLMQHYVFSTVDSLKDLTSMTIFPLKNGKKFMHTQCLPKEIIIKKRPKQKKMLEHILQSQTTHKVSIVSPQQGKKKRWLNLAERSAAQSLIAQMMHKNNLEARCDALEKALKPYLTIPLSRIECFDISHTAGCSTVASCVVFNRFGPEKEAYRRFNIKGITPGDDLAAIHDAVLRRFKRLKEEACALPSLVLIDGGPLQLRAARSAMLELNISDVMFIGVAKGPLRRPGEEVLHFTNKETLSLSSDSLALHFIQQIRDEAHRFAITGHRKQRDKRQLQSVLEHISGVGIKRRQALLCYFGGIQGLTHASLEELIKVPGIHEALAKRIVSTLHDRAG